MHSLVDMSQETGAHDKIDPICSVSGYDGNQLTMTLINMLEYYRNDFLRLLFSFLLQEAVARLEEIKKSVEAKMALRQSNLNPERPGQ